MKVIYSVMTITLLLLIFNTKVLALFNNNTQDHENNSPVLENKEVIVLLHGLGRDNKSMWLLASRLEDADYHVHRIEYSSLDQQPAEIVTDISKQINKCCLGQFKKIHFVGHSLGGLIIRAYLQQHKVDNLGRVVLIGTPNKGSEVADHFSDSWLIELLGPTAQSLGTGKNSFPNSLLPPYYPLGVIAGENDSILKNLIIPEKNDGLVSVSSAKVEGMTDFILINTSHSMMRYNSEVAEQTIEYIKNGSFSRIKN